jgi:hypothetical protein
VKVSEASGGIPLVAVTVAMYVPAVVGVPAMVPPVDKLSPGGKEPEVTVVVGAGVAASEKE